MSLTLDGTSGITSSGGTNVLQADAVITSNLVNGAVTEAKIANLAVTEGKIANSAVTDAKISAVAATKLTGTVPTARLGSGTASSTTFLRGDQTWQTINTTPTTDQVLTATAGASAGAVGTYMFARSSTTSDVAFGSTRAGSALLPTSAMYNLSVGGSGDNVVFISGSAQAGTWRAMGTYDYLVVNANTGASGATLWLRIS